MAFSRDALLKAYETVQTKYSFPFKLKDQQIDAIFEVINREHHTFAVLPTGFGKSEICMLPPLLLDELKPNEKHRAIVVVPLISLMKDMESKFGQRGLRIKYFRSDAVDKDDVDKLKDGYFSIILISPETFDKSALCRDLLLMNRQFRDSVCLLAIDEAHLLIHWGDQFRPSYKMMRELRSYFDNAMVLFMTATCPVNIRDRILEVMGIDEDDVVNIVKVPDRPNISLNFHEDHPSALEDTMKWYLDELHRDGVKTRKMVIYCRSIRFTGRGFGMLVYTAGAGAFTGTKHFKNKLIAEYHAEVEDNDKERLLEEFRKKDSHIRCLISTVAFGIGIDIPDIRIIVHWGESENVAQYWQEVGRAGRDGQAAEAHLYHRPLQLLQCGEDMKKVVCNVKAKKCIRREVLAAVNLSGDPIVSQEQDGECCSVCSESK